MKSICIATLLGTAVFLGACEPTPAEPGEVQRSTEIARPLPPVEAQENFSAAMRKQLAAVRAATARYQNVEVAIQEGFVPISPCVSDPQLGGMGIHYARQDRMGDAIVNPTEPEMLLYVPQPNGELKLLGVEYWIFEEVWDASGNGGTPMFVDRPFDHNPAGHGMPARYSLHVWTWHPNPSGMFAPFNPRISCPPEAPERHLDSAHRSH